MSDESKFGRCWLCGRWAKLTREHIPPHSAFNDRPILMMAIEENTLKTGRLQWAGKVEEGMIVKSLCGDCNSRGGSKYGTHYADFISRVALIVEKAKDGEHIIISGVKRPLSILKQSMQSFVSANGPHFVSANPWVRKFIRNSRNQEWPRDVFAYMFATSSKGGRRTGVMSFYDFALRRIETVAEFTFWPIGVVLSFGQELHGYPVTPIHQWSEFAYTWTGELDVDLVVNPSSSAYALDFRTREQICKEGLRLNPKPIVDGENLKQIMSLAKQRSGAVDDKTWSFVGQQIPTIKEES
jgi:hypothetical protein